MIVEWIIRGKPTVIGICSGAVAGLVAITPASGFVRSDGCVRDRYRGRRRLLLGLHRAEHFFGYDDALDAFGVHAVGGRDEPSPRCSQWRLTVARPRAHRGQPGQVLTQLIGVATVFVYDVVVT